MINTNRIQYLNAQPSVFIKVKIDYKDIFVSENFLYSYNWIVYIGNKSYRILKFLVKYKQKCFGQREVRIGAVWSIAEQSDKNQQIYYH
jgi:hypothetical protein